MLDFLALGGGQETRWEGILEVLPSLLALGKSNGFVRSNHFFLPEEQQLAVVVLLILECKKHSLRVPLGGVQSGERTKSFVVLS